jgi:hypothetical protein
MMRVGADIVRASAGIKVEHNAAQRETFAGR